MISHSKESIISLSKTRFTLKSVFKVLLHPFVLSAFQLEEQEMATGQGREELENVVNNLVRNILKSMPELTNAANLKSKNLNYESDIEGPIIDSILSQLDSLKNKVGSVVTEMSGMAAGAVGGFSGPIGVEEDEEQKSYRRS